MSYYCSVDELTSRIFFLSSIYPQYRHKFPILSWSYQNDEKKLMEQLTQRGIKATLGKGAYYDSYAEGDWDLYVVTNYDEDSFSFSEGSIGATKTIQTIKYMTCIFQKDSEGIHIYLGSSQSYYPMYDGPSDLNKLSPDSTIIPEEQVKILQALYPKSWTKFKFYKGPSYVYGTEQSAIPFATVTPVTA